MSDDDTFRDAMSDVAPLQGKRRVQHDKAIGEATPAQLERREAALGNRETARVDPNYLTLGEVPQRQPHDVLEWKKVGVQRGVFARLKAGKYPIEASLDLHRHTVKQSRSALFKFFNLAFARGWRTVIVAHGRGEKSPTPARIKSYVAAWLVEVPQVIAFHSARSNQGGTGAVYVLLKKSPAAKNENREQYGGKGEPDL
ncbi:MAG: DNA endonuclease SmrA [Gammaproteobacteria bacterium]|nr:DNA endonuclease SmrA [Gammaproteobacteria bacterium]